MGNPSLEKIYNIRVGKLVLLDDEQDLCAPFMISNTRKESLFVKKKPVLTGLRFFDIISMHVRVPPSPGRAFFLILLLPHRLVLHHP
jgi:hypothetical protein